MFYALVSIDTIIVAIVVVAVIVVVVDVVGSGSGQLYCVVLYVH